MSRFPHPWRLVMPPAEPDGAPSDAWFDAMDRHTLRHGRVSGFVEAANGSIVFYLDPSGGEYTPCLSQQALDTILAMSQVLA